MKFLGGHFWVKVEGQAPLCYAAVGWWVGWCLTLKIVKIQKVQIWFK